MNALSFVKCVDTHVKQDTIRFMLDTLKNEHAKDQPRNDVLARLSCWYQRLNDEEKNLARTLVHNAVQFTALKFLGILDGADIVEFGPDAGEFELYHVSPKGRVRLNNPNGPSLNEELGVD